MLEIIVYPGENPSFVTTFFQGEQPSDTSVSSRAPRCYTEVNWFLPSGDEPSKSNVCLL